MADVCMVKAMRCPLTEQHQIHPLRRLLTILAEATNPIEDEEGHSDINLYAPDEDDEEYGYERNDDEDEDEEEDEDF